MVRIQPAQPTSPGVAHSPVVALKPAAFRALWRPIPNRRQCQARVFGAKAPAVSIRELAVRFWGWFVSADAEQLALCRPSDRQVQGPDQSMGSQLGRLTSRGDRVDNDRRQEGERQ